MVPRLAADSRVGGAGAAGMAFTDALIDHADVHVTVVDRRHGPGGHWLDAYPFVQLHQASLFYGVASTVARDGPQGLLPSAEAAYVTNEQGFLDVLDAQRVQRSAGPIQPDAVLARHLGVEPETAMQETNSRFLKRFKGVEALATESGHTLAELSLAEMDALWDEAKAEEGQRRSRSEEP